MCQRPANNTRAYFVCSMNSDSNNPEVPYQVHIGNIVFFLDGIVPMEDNGNEILYYEGVRTELFPGGIYSIK